MSPTKELYKHTSSDTFSHPILSIFSTTTAFLQNPTVYSSEKDSTQYSNLHHYYFNPLTHISFSSISSSTLPLTKLESLSEAIVSPSGNIPTVIHYPHHVLSPILNPSKILTDDPSILLPTQLYTSVYFPLSRSPHMTYLNL